MTDIKTIKRMFAEEYPDAALAIDSGSAQDKVSALALYGAFKRGFLRGYEHFGDAE